MCKHAGVNYIPVEPLKKGHMGAGIKCVHVEGWPFCPVDFCPIHVYQHKFSNFRGVSKFTVSMHTTLNGQ